MDLVVAITVTVAITVAVAGAVAIARHSSECPCVQLRI